MFSQADVQNAKKAVTIIVEATARVKKNKKKYQLALAENMIDAVAILDTNSLNSCDTIIKQLAMVIQSNSMLGEDAVPENIKHILKLIALAKNQLPPATKNVKTIDTLIETLSESSQDKKIKSAIKELKNSIIHDATEEKDSHASIQSLIQLIQKFNDQKNKISALSRKFKKPSDFSPHIILLEIWVAIISIPITNLKKLDAQRKAEEKQQELIRKMVQQGIEALTKAPVNASSVPDKDADIPVPPELHLEEDNIPPAPDLNLKENNIPIAPPSVPVPPSSLPNNNSLIISTEMLTRKLKPVKKDEHKSVPEDTNSTHATLHAQLMLSIVNRNLDPKKGTALAHKIENTINEKNKQQNHASVSVPRSAPARATIPQLKKQPTLAIIIDANPTLNPEYKKLKETNEPAILFAVVFPENTKGKSLKEQEPKIHAYLNQTRPITKIVLDEDHECDKLIRRWIKGKDSRDVNTLELNNDRELMRNLKVNMVTVDGATDLFAELKAGVKLRSVIPAPAPAKIKSVEIKDERDGTPSSDNTIPQQTVEEKNPLSLLKTAATSANAAYKYHHANNKGIFGLHLSWMKVSHHGGDGADNANTLEQKVGEAHTINEAENFLSKHFSKKANEDELSFSNFIWQEIRKEPLLLKRYNMNQTDGLQKLKEYFSKNYPQSQHTSSSPSPSMPTIYGHSCD